MNSDYDNTTGELIELFIDGELSGIRQSMLFRALANDETLQSEFHHALAVRRAIQDDRESLSLAPDIKDGLFARASLVPAGAMMTPLVLPPVDPGSRGSTWWQRHSDKVVSALGGAIFSALIIFGLAEIVAPADRSPDVLEYGQVGPVDNSVSMDHRSSTDLPVSELRFSDGAAAAEQEAAAPVVEQGQPSKVNAFTETTKQAGAAIDLHEDLPATVDNVSIAKPLSPQRRVFSARHSPLQSGPSSGTPRLAPSLPAAPSNISRFSLQLNGIEGLALWPDYNVAESRGPFFNNRSASLLYRLDKRNALGLAAGKESLPHVVLKGATAERRVRLSWIGLRYQHVLRDLAPVPKLHPLLQLTGAWTDVGLLAKGMAGLRYGLDDSVQMQLGLEGSSLRSRWRTTDKLALVYGISIFW